MTYTNIDGVSSKLRLGRNGYIVSNDISSIKFARDSGAENLANIHARNIYGENITISGTITVDSLSLSNLTATNGTISNLTSPLADITTLTGTTGNFQNATISATLNSKDIVSTGSLVANTITSNSATITNVTSAKTSYTKDETVYDVKVDSSLGFLDVDRGFGIKNSGYITNVILGMKTANYFEGDVFFLNKGLTANCSAGRLTTNGYSYQVANNYIEVQYDAQINIAEYKTQGTKDYQIWYNNENQQLFVVDSERFHYDDFEPEEPDDYDLWHSANLNRNYKRENGVWVEKNYLIKVAEFSVEKQAYSKKTAYYPSDLLKSIDYLVANQGGGNKLVVCTQHIDASEASTSSITLVGEKPCKDASHMFAMVEHTVLPTTDYTLNEAGTILTFKKPVDPGLRIELRWYSDFSAVDISSEIKQVFLTGTADSYENVIAVPDKQTISITNNGMVTITPASEIETGDYVKIYYELDNGEKLLIGCLNDFCEVYSGPVSDTTKLSFISNNAVGIEIKINVILARCE